MADVQAVYLSIAGDVSTAVASAEGTVSTTTASLSGDLTWEVVSDVTGPDEEELFPEEIAEALEDIL